MIIFYCENIQTCPELSEEDSGHAVRVLRHVEGDKIMVVDGVGHFYQCAITGAHPKHCGLQILSVEEERHWPYSVELAIAPTKNLDRMEWWLEKATEMGLDRFTPLKCRFSERKELKMERMRKIAISAMKQSLKATLPLLDEMTDIKRFLEEPFEGQKFIAHCMKDEPRKLLSHEVRPNTAVRVLIGPEGDFSPEEVQLALANGYVPVSLGDQRLRTETAALASVHTVHIINELQ
ncbi:MAG: 16S rRNA (uracil(1498)-N(3))-methyltransferase [Bacteroidales bacterium]|nr:16S rRNA (uracil(1498)-N(3))-methyltransferase [Bacteroidales bacterium]